MPRARTLATTVGVVCLLVAVADPARAQDAPPGPPPVFTAADICDRATVELECRQFDLAIAHYSEAIRLDPKLAIAYAGRGQARGETREFDLALADFDQAIRLAPNFAEAYYMRGVLRFERKEFDRAISDLTEAFRRDPQHWEAINGRAIAKNSLGDLDGAISDYTEASRLLPSSAIPLLGRASAWQRKKESDKAAADFDLAIRIDPKSSIAHINRGNFRRMGMRFDEAIADFSEAIRIDPQLSFVYLNRGSAKAAKADYLDAVADYDEALRGGLRLPSMGENVKCALRLFYFEEEFSATDHPGLFECLTRLSRGDALRHLSRHAEALADYDRATQLAPNFPASHYRRAWLLSTCHEAGFRDGRRAVVSATRACELSGWKSPYALVTLAAAYAETGDFDAAIRWEDKAQGLRDEKDRADGRQRLELYRARKPFRETPEAPGAARP